MDCLNGLNWLNDEFINVTMGLLQQRELHRNPGRSYHPTTLFAQLTYCCLETGSANGRTTLH